MERGNGDDLQHHVAPLAGAWIEISQRPYTRRFNGVAPLAGAWIEIQMLRPAHNTQLVAPLAGAWIEMMLCQNVTDS